AQGLFTNIVLVQIALAHLQRAFEKSESGRANTPELAELLSWHVQQLPQTASLSEQVSTKVHRIAAAGAMSDKECQEFGVAERLRATPDQFFAGPFGFMPVFDRHVTFPC